MRRSMRDMQLSRQENILGDLPTTTQNGCLSSGKRSEGAGGSLANMSARPTTPNLRPVRSASEFLHDPIGHYLAGRSFLIWVLSPTLAGSIYFDRPDESEFPVLFELFALPMHHALEVPFDAVIDCSRLTGLSLDSFDALTQHLMNVGQVSDRVRRVACVRPHGMPGATIAGLFYERVMPRFAAALFTDATEGFRWLGRAGGDGERAALEQVVDGLLEAPSELSALRQWLADNLDAPTIERAARSIGMSGRSLQRKLLLSDTSFRREVDRARVRSAEALLLDRDSKIEVIARRVGCSSASHFATLFRRVTGEAPGDFRARRS